MKSPLKLPVVEPWYKDGLSFQCTQCGNCCTGGPGYVWVSDEELERLAKHLKLTPADTLRTYCRKIQGRLSLKERVTPQGLYDCVFLKTIEVDGKARRVCGIYEVRPLQCRTWPFWDGLLASPKSWQAATRTCPGIDKGKHYPLEQIEALRTAPDWPDAQHTPGSK